MSLIYPSPRIFERMNRLFFVFPVASVIWAAMSLPARAAQERVVFTSSATDPAITQFNNPHYAVVDPAVTARGRLVLMLPGTGATPFNLPRLSPERRESRLSRAGADGSEWRRDKCALRSERPA